MAYNKEELSGQLQQGTWDVVFKKRDGSLRQMICTLDPTLAPKIQQVRVSNAPVNSSPDVVPVWDLEKMAWRSFRVDSVLHFNKQEGQ